MNADYTALTGKPGPFPNVPPPPKPASGAASLLAAVKAVLDAQSAAIAAFLNTSPTTADDGPRVHGR